jgi:hypothetical protein
MIIDIDRNLFIIDGWQSEISWFNFLLSCGFWWRSKVTVLRSCIGCIASFHEQMYILEVLAEEHLQIALAQAESPYCAELE